MNKLFSSWLKMRYSLYSPFYDVFIGKLFMKLRKRSISLAEIKAHENILIVGAGTGLDLVFLRGDNPITAIDISTGMLNRLRNRATKLKLPVQVAIMDATKLSFPDHSFDVVILHMILAVIPDYKSCVREASRVLKPKGRMMVFDKFLPNEKTPSLFRKLINPLAIVVASDLNRSPSDVIIEGLQKVFEERTGILNLFRIIKLVKGE